MKPGRASSQAITCAACDSPDVSAEHNNKKDENLRREHPECSVQISALPHLEFQDVKPVTVKAANAAKTLDGSRLLWTAHPLGPPRPGSGP